MSEEKLELAVPEPPPPSEALRAVIAATAPVAVSGRWRELALVASFFVACALVAALGMGLRADLMGLPPGKMIAGTLVWCALLLLAVVAATRPRRGQVLPSVTRARRMALALPLLAAAAASVLLVDAPGLTRHPAEQAGPIVHCLSRGLLVALLPFFVVLHRARRKLLVGAAWMGAVLGVAAGSVGALVLHLACSTGGRTHVLGGHVAVLALMGLVGALAGALARRR